MNRSGRARWRLVAISLVVGSCAIACFELLGIDLAAWAAGIAALIVAWVVRPRAHQTSLTHWVAQDRHVKDGTPIIYWRPGSLRCAMVRIAVGRHWREAAWVDIWADEEGAAFVRDLNNGAEVVPTVILRNGDAVAKPDPAMVAAELIAH